MLATTPTQPASPRYVYVTQYGGWWRLSGKEWRDIVLRCAQHNAGGYMLPQSRALSRRPPAIGAYRVENAEGDTAWRYYARRPCDALVMPLDWDTDDFIEEAFDRGWLTDQEVGDL